MPDTFQALSVLLLAMLPGALYIWGFEREAYPDAQDLYLAALADVDPVSGEFRLDEGKPLTRPSGLLVRWDEIEYLEFTPADPNEAREATT